MRDQTLSVRSDIYGERTPATHHPQGEPPSSGSGPSASPRIPTTPDVQTPRPSRGVGVNARSGLKPFALHPERFRVKDPLPRTEDLPGADCPPRSPTLDRAPRPVAD